MFFRFHTLGTNLLEAPSWKKDFLRSFSFFPSSLQAVRPGRKQTLTLIPSYAASDSLTLNYTLMSPKKYGITDLPDGFSSFSLHDLKQMQTSTENTLARLHNFAKNNLSREDRLLYDTLDASLTLSLVFVRPFEWNSGAAPGSSLWIYSYRQTGLWPVFFFTRVHSCLL